MRCKRIRSTRPRRRPGQQTRERAQDRCTPLRPRSQVLAPPRMLRQPAKGRVNVTTTAPSLPCEAAVFCHQSELLKTFRSVHHRRLARCRLLPSAPCGLRRMLAVETVPIGISIECWSRRWAAWIRTGFEGCISMDPTCRARTSPSPERSGRPAPTARRARGTVLRSRESTGPH